MTGIRISDNTAENRYEARVDDELAGFSEYQRGSGRVVFTHTETLPGFAGRGVGSALARAGLDDARARGLTVLPLCSFVKQWIERHSDYADLVHTAQPGTEAD